MKPKTKVYLKEVFVLSSIIGLSFLLGLFSYKIYEHSYDYNKIDVSVAKVLFNNIPEVYFDGLKEFVFEKEKPLKRIISDIKDNFNTAAYFKYDKITVYELDTITRDELDRYVAHEVAHNVFKKFLTEEDRNEWELIYNKTKKEDFITSYSSTDAEENFCETFRIYLDSQTSYIRKYLKYYTYGIDYDPEGFQEIDKERLKFIIDRVIQRYEFDRILEINSNLKMEIGYE